MTTKARAGSERYVGRIVDEVTAWDGIVAQPHRFGGTEFLLGPREVGHVHRVGIVDINFPKRMRDHLVAEGRTGEHHVVPESGWTTLYVETEGDVDRALWLFRLSYLYLALTMKEKSAGRAALAGLDVDAELDELEPNEDLRAMIERVRAR
ncbi:luciferase domain-containing protein [Halegenticoccus tardaugens]|uniref:luciferase domain-containing protein n=1 Tax=Halegenticoccus tardaugens TaxID=2071624 RepID=UPI00100AEFF5|nr:luciferase family protein [Halegenticoccus tardaugens]